MFSVLVNRSRVTFPADVHPGIALHGHRVFFQVKSQGLRFGEKLRDWKHVARPVPDLTAPAVKHIRVHFQRSRYLAKRTSITMI